MESQQPSYCNEIRRLYRLIESTSLEYLSVDHLRELGIEATQIDLADGKLQFDPYFFQPQQHSLHERYPLLDKPQKLRKLTFQRSWDRCILEAADEGVELVRTGYWSAEDLKCREDKLFRDAKYQYLSSLRLEREADVGDRSQQTLLYMQQLLGAQRVNPDLPPPDLLPFCLSDLSPLTEGWRTKESKGDPQLANLFYPHKVRWRIEDILEDLDSKPKPHAVLWNWVEFAAGPAPESLTIHEVQSIVRWFMIRAKRSTWRQHRIQPMLLVSYTGSQDGRIVQAHYDGKKLNLQFSALFQMKDEKTAPIDLFLRYTVSTPVGHTLQVDKSR
ncbi:hypothetical protein PEBR_03763 [Penicillium brasilianum]|uniref:Uncharacterized protein n=1 Tax=Penicillium brasilianum TaxID=104259 RepID=A0A1S9S055_PENBI|nr:hypothetical protein PEBR_03763 [Penicillium brasilianum]